MSRPPILVTGGAGFIGSHICKALHQAGRIPVVFDNLSTGHSDNVRWGPLVQGNLQDTPVLSSAIALYRPDCVIHCAANAYVGESVGNPQKYYDNNVRGSLALLDTCLSSGLGQIVFSSSCATYGVPPVLPISEASEQIPINPYGRTKLIFEMMLQDYAAAYGLKFAVLRYFNAAGADPDGQLRERHDPETHLVPCALLAAAGRKDRLEVYGTDYATVDGTCVRDYVHVSDLARAHVAAVSYLEHGRNTLSVNLGSGHGTSIKQVLDSIERLTHRPVPVVFKPRRAGDPPILFADTRMARETLGFEPVLSDIDTIIRTAAPSFGLEVRS